MRRPLLLVSVLLGIAIVLILVIALTLSNPEAYRDQILEHVSTSTGYQVAIDGDVSWRYWPLIALDVNKISIRLPGRETQLLHIAKASIDLDLLPLLMGKQTIGIKGLLIDGLTIQAIIDEAGRDNWTLDTGPDAATSQPAGHSTDKDQKKATSGERPLQIHISNIELSNVSIDFHDQQSNSHYLLAIPSMTTGVIAYDTPVNFQLAFKANDLASEFAASGTMNGSLTSNESGKSISFEGFHIAADIGSPERKILDASITLDGEINLHTDIAKIHQGELRFGEFKPSFDITINRFSGGSPQFNGNIRLPPLNLKNLMTQFGIIPPATTRPEALSHLSLDTQFSGNSKTIRLTKIDGSLDQTAFRGSMGISMSNQTSISFDLALDEINVSDYLEPAAGSAVNKQSPTTAKRSINKPDNTTQAPQKMTVIADSEIIPLTLLRETNIAGKLSIGKIAYDSHLISDYHLSIQNQDQRLQVLMDGSAFEGNASIDLKSEFRNSASTTALVNINDMDLGALSDLESISGQLTLASRLTFRGSMMSDLLDTLDGTSEFTVNDGMLDVRPIKRVATTVGALRGKQSSISQWPDQMPFSTLNGSHRFNKGIVQYQRLRFNLENMWIQGSGGIDYFPQQINYDFFATMTESSDGPFSVPEALTGIEWPIHCKGPLSASASDICRADVKAIQHLVADIAKQEIKSRGQKEIDKVLEDKVPEDLKSLLKGLFK
jgi:AsmA protein